MRRVILWREKYFIDIFEVLCSSIRSLDWVCHLRGQLIERPSNLKLVDPLSGGGGFSHINLKGQIQETENSLLRWNHNKGCLDLYLLSPFGILKLGNAPSNPANEQLSTVIRHQHASRSAFISVFAPWQENEEPPVQEVSGNWQDGAPWNLTVKTPRGIEKWKIGSSTEEIQLITP